VGLEPHDEHICPVAQVNYLTELSLMEYSFLRYRPSMRAAACLYLARRTLGEGRGRPPVWTPTIEHYIGYKLADLEECVRHLHKVHVNAEWTSLQSVRRKFDQSCTYHVSDIICAREEDLFSSSP
jgi:hypothetical protein